MDFTSYINPALLILIPVLYLLGTFLKSSERIDDRFIPLTLGGVGVGLAILYVLSVSDVTTLREGCTAAFTALVQGTLCAGGAVFGNQIYKQGRK